jgi:dephospho-CoA kinase
MPTPGTGEFPHSSVPGCIALTGGIGAGKSTALDAFAACGAATLSSDDVVHGLYADPDVLERVRARFGPDVVAGDGRIDRNALAAAAFGADGGMAFLEGLLFPRIESARENWIADRQRERIWPLLVVEVPLLFEAGLADRFDAVVVVTASESIRRARVAGRGQDFAVRSGRQWNEDQKVRAADRAFVNDGDVDALRAWVAEVFAEFAASAPS